MNRNGYKNKSVPLATNQPHGDVRQDKNAPGRALSGSVEPSAITTPASARTPSAPKPKRHGSNRRQRVQVYGWVRREVAAEIERLRDQGDGRRLSRSSVVAGILERGVQAHIDLQYGALFKPVIEEAITGRFAARDARFAALLVRIAYDSGQNRALLTNLLARSPGMSPDVLDAILDQSGKRAKANLTHLSPQITELIKVVETWMREKTEEGRRNSS